MWSFFHSQSCYVPQHQPYKHAPWLTLSPVSLSPYCPYLLYWSCILRDVGPAVQDLTSTECHLPWPSWGVYWTNSHQTSHRHSVLWAQCQSMHWLKKHYLVSFNVVILTILLYHFAVCMSVYKVCIPLMNLFLIFSGHQHDPEKLLPVHVRRFPSKPS